MNIFEYFDKFENIEILKLIDTNNLNTQRKAKDALNIQKKITILVFPNERCYKKVYGCFCSSSELSRESHIRTGVS